MHISLTETARTFFFTCEFFWLVLSMGSEEVVSPETMTAFEDTFRDDHGMLCEWALESRNTPFELEKPDEAEREFLFRLSDRVSDEALVRWLESLHLAAQRAQRTFATNRSQSWWLFQYYRSFLQQVLIEFEQVLHARQDMQPYHAAYRLAEDSLGSLALNIEKNQHKTVTEIAADKAAYEGVRTDLITFASRLGAEWRQAVLSIARDLKLNFE